MENNLKNYLIEKAFFAEEHFSEGVLNKFLPITPGSL